MHGRVHSHIQAGGHEGGRATGQEERIKIRHMPERFIIINTKNASAIVHRAVPPPSPVCKEMMNKQMRQGDIMWTGGDCANAPMLVDPLSHSAALQAAEPDAQAHGAQPTHERALVRAHAAPCAENEAQC